MFNRQITFIGDSPDESTVKEALRLSDSVRAQKEAAGASQMIKGFDLPDGTQVYVVDLSDTCTVQITPPPLPLEYSLYTPRWGDLPIAEPLPIIGVVSGAVTTGVGDYVDVQIGVDEYGDPITVSVLNIINPSFVVRRVTGGAARPRTAELFSERDVAIKIGVPEHEGFRSVAAGMQSLSWGYGPAAFGPVANTQFVSHDAGFFTGVMQPLVQLLLGVGRLSENDYEVRLIEALRGTEASPITQIIEENMQIGVEEFETLAVDTIGRPHDEGDAHPDGVWFHQIRILYDYRWSKTNGIVFGTREALPFAPEVQMMASPDRSQEPFLAELSNRGIFIMPLPRDEASFFPEVQAQYLKVYPELDQHRPFRGDSLFNALGGFPSGVTIPHDKESLDRWIRAGVVIEANRDLSEFYSGSAFTSMHGWAFSDDGTKAIGVTRKFYGGYGESKGECYEVTFDINQRSNIEFNLQSEMVIQRLGLVDPVEIYKAHRLSEDQMHYIFTPGMRGNHRSEYEAFDEVEVEPDFNFRVSIVKLREGPLNYNERMCVFDNNCYPPGIQFKVFEPAAGFTFSVDFSVSPLVRSTAWADGPVFAAYVRNQPEILHVYSEPAVEQEPTGSTRQPCQFVGSWVEDNTRRNANTTGDFYTSTHDFRRTQQPISGSIRYVTARILGGVNQGCLYCFSSIRMYFQRVMYYAWGYTSHTFASYFRRVSVMCAANNRSVFFVRDGESYRESQNGEGHSGALSFGPTGITHLGYIYSFIFHWNGLCGDFSIGSLSGYLQKAGVQRNSGCAAMLFPEAPPFPSYSILRSSGKYDGESAFDSSALIVNSPFNGGAIPGGASGYNCANYSPDINSPRSWSTLSKPVRRVSYAIYGFGLPEMNGVVLQSGSTTAEEGSPLTASELSHAFWDHCAVPSAWNPCFVPAWFVARNHYGTPFMRTTSQNLFGDPVEHGREPELAGGAGGRIFFGVVDE